VTTAAAGRARLVGALDRVVTDLRRHTTPARALGALLAAVLLTATTLAAVAPGSTGRREPPAAAVPTFIDRPPLPGIAGGPDPLDRLGAAPVGEAAMPADEFVGWALFDQRARTISGSGNMATTSTTASMVKVWLAADYLRLTAESGGEPSPSRLDELTLMVRDSDNEIAEELFEELGEHESIERLVATCGLLDARVVPNQWSGTQLSPRDTALLGVCIEDGRAAGPRWTPWLLDEMRAVRGMGDFGIRDALPADQRSTVAIKNGWVIRDSQDAWHVSCLAIGDGWTMGVMVRYPAELGQEHGAEACRSLAAEHLATGSGTG
jgi:hypothetical protein